MAQYFGDEMDQHRHSGFSRITAHQSRVTNVEQSRPDVVTDGVDQECFTTAMRSGQQDGSGQRRSLPDLLRAFIIQYSDE